MKKTIYSKLKVGDIFKLYPKDKREYRVEKDGATEIKDIYGYRTDERFKCYCYLTMPVYVEED